MKLSVRELVYISILACIQSITFTSFSSVLYLECITLVTVLFAMVFKPKIAIMASIIFGLVNIVSMGATIWTLMYLVIYPLYSLVVSIFKQYLNKHFLVLILLCGFLSFSTGQLLQIPWLLISDKITIIYIVMGLKTSLVQGFIAGVTCFACYKPLYKILSILERNKGI